MTQVESEELRHIKGGEGEEEELRHINGGKEGEREELIQSDCRSYLYVVRNCVLNWDRGSLSWH